LNAVICEVSRMMHSYTTECRNVQKKTKSNQIIYYIIVRPEVDQRAGQLCLPHVGITKTEKNTTKT